MGEEHRRITDVLSEAGPGESVPLDKYLGVELLVLSIVTLPGVKYDGDWAMISAVVTETGEEITARTSSNPVIDKLKRATQLAALPVLATPMQKVAAGGRTYLDLT